MNMRAAFHFDAEPRTHRHEGFEHFSRTVSEVVRCGSAHSDIAWGDLPILDLRPFSRSQTLEHKRVIEEWLTGSKWSHMRMLRLSAAAMNIFCVFFSDLEDELAEEVDRSLETAVGYLGASSPLPSLSVHRGFYDERLPTVGRIDGQLVTLWSNSQDRPSGLAAELRARILGIDVQFAPHPRWPLA